MEQSYFSASSQSGNRDLNRNPSAGRERQNSSRSNSSKTTTDDLAEGEEFNPERQNGPKSPKRSGAV